MSHHVKQAAFLLIPAALILATTSARAADAACKPVFDAMVKMAGTPNHQYLTETAGYSKGSTNGEIITTPTAMYIKAAGSWHSDAYNPQQQVTELRQAYAAKPMTCKYLRDESAGGEAAAMYDTRETQDDGTVVISQLWISKSHGLPVKQTIDMDVGGKNGKSHNELRIDYANVQPPAGVK